VVCAAPSSLATGKRPTSAPPRSFPVKLVKEPSPYLQPQPRLPPNFEQQFQQPTISNQGVAHLTANARRSVQVRICTLPAPCQSPPPRWPSARGLSHTLSRSTTKRFISPAYAQHLEPYPSLDTRWALVASPRVCVCVCVYECVCVFGYGRESQGSPSKPYLSACADMLGDWPWAQAGYEPPKDPFLERYLQHTKDLYSQGPETVIKRPQTAGPQPMRPQLWAPPWQSPPPNMCVHPWGAVVTR
jgi:hypothetical protein